MMPRKTKAQIAANKREALKKIKRAESEVKTANEDNESSIIC